MLVSPAPTVLGIQAHAVTFCSLYGFWEFELRYYTARTLTHRAVCPSLMVIIKIHDEKNKMPTKNVMSKKVMTELRKKNLLGVISLNHNEVH